MSEGSPFETSYHNESINKDSHFKVSEVSNEAFEKDEDENELVLSCYNLGRTSNAKYSEGKVMNNEKYGMTSDSEETPLNSECISKDIKDVLNNCDGKEVIDNATFTKNPPELMNGNYLDPPSSPTVNNNIADENDTNFEQLAGQESPHKLARQESSDNCVTLFDRYIKKVPSTNEIKQDEFALLTPELPAGANDANILIEEQVFTTASSDFSNAEKGIPGAKAVEEEINNQKLEDKITLGHNIINGSVSSVDSTICDEAENNNTKVIDINSSDNVNSKVADDDIIYYLKIRKTSSDVSKKNVQNSNEGRNSKTPDCSLAKIVNNKRENVNSNFNKSCPLHKSESIPNINEHATNDNEPLISKKDNFRPIYRLSMRLSQSVFGNIDIPNADTHRQYDKAGYLLKLSGRGFPYLHQWKRRYCVLTKSALYVYEKENSRGCEKSSFIIDLKYFDHVAEAMQKESKKAPNVFVVTSQDRSFFDPAHLRVSDFVDLADEEIRYVSTMLAPYKNIKGRHLFSADTLTDMHEWISKLREAVELIRNNNRPTSKISSTKSAEEKTLKEIRQSLNESLKGPTDRRRSKEIADTDENRRISGQVEQDAVDSKTMLINKMDEELKASLEKKRKRESAHRKPSLVGTEASDRVEKDFSKDEEEEVKLPRKKSSTKKVILLSPSTQDSDSKPLESITKHRNKGPQGRRAPQSRRTVHMKQRASSMSALQHGGPLEDSSRDDNWVNVSADVLEEDNLGQESGSLNTSHPALAYRYSSDEDSASDDVKDAEDYFAPSRPVSASYNIPEILHKPVEGLRVYVPQIEMRKNGARGGSPPLQSSEINQELLEYRSLPRQPRTKSFGVSQSPLTKLPSFGRSSSGKLSSGRASPEMDALDNLLMSQSIRPANIPAEDTSDHEGSDVSTCKGTQYDAEVVKSHSNDEFSKNLHSFRSSLQHLQHHTAELEMRTKRIEADVSISRKEITNLLESSRNLQSDVEQLAKAVSIISEETSSAHKQIISQRKETEQIQRGASAALSDAKRAQAQYELAKNNYECLIKELHSLVTSIRTSLIVNDHEELRPQQPSQIISEKEVKKEKEVKIKLENETDKRSSNKDLNKMSGYQSFFQRPSSLIYGLTVRNVNKQLTTVDKSSKAKKEEKPTYHKKDSEERKCKGGEGSLEKKQDKSAQNSLEKKSKSAKKVVAHLEQDAESGPKEGKAKEPKNFQNCGVKITSRKLSKLSFEKIPMMDEHSEHVENREPKVEISQVTINVSPPLHNYNVEKSQSSPLVTAKGLSHRKSHPMSISQTNKDQITPQSSPDSSPSGPAPYIFGSEKHITNSAKEFRFHTEASLFPMSPSDASPIRSSFKTNVPEERSAQTRLGTFAISRQNSYPNIPAQRQNPGTLFPLQRQHSLGTVPEEGQLPRQLSLRSVPEERPIVDQTLPLSPSPSMASFSLSPSPSAGGLDALRERNTVRNSMELVTGPVISSSQAQESYIRPLPPSSEFLIGGDIPVATSSLKKSNGRKKNSRVVHV